MPRLDLPLGPVDVVEEGDPTGPPVVFVHGFGANMDLWKSTSAALGERARSIRVTWPLGSHRLHVGRPYGPGDVAGAILDLCDALDLDDPTLVGNDTGGGLCQIALHQRPERVRRLVLTNADCFRVFPPFPLQPFRWSAKVPGGVTAFLAPTRPTLLRHLLFYGTLATRRDDALWADFLDPWHTSRDTRRDATSFLRRASLDELERATLALADWEGEAVLVWGMRDPFFRPKLGRRLAETIGAPMIEVPDAKAFVPLDAPEVLADAIAGIAAGARAVDVAGAAA